MDPSLLPRDNTYPIPLTLAQPSRLVQNLLQRLLFGYALGERRCVGVDLEW